MSGEPTPITPTTSELTATPDRPQSGSTKGIPASQTTRAVGDSVEACIKRYAIFRFLSGHANQPLLLKLARAFCLVALSWLLAKGLLFLFNVVIFSNQLISLDALKEMNRLLAVATSSPTAGGAELPSLELHYKNSTGHEAVYATISPTGNHSATDTLKYNIVSREITDIPFFWPITIISSEVSVDALIKCYELFASQPPSGKTAPSEEVLKTCLKTFRAVLIGSQQVNIPQGSDTGGEAKKTTIGFGYVEDAFGEIAYQRRINGYIQFFSIWGFSMFLILATARGLAVSRFQSSLLRTRYFSAKGGKPLDAPWMQLRDTLKELGETEDYVKYDEIFQKRSKDLALRYEQVNEILEKRRCFSAHASLMRQALTASLTDTTIAANIPAFVSTQSGILSALAYEGAALLRFLVWVVPTIGFVGTVFGISHTLQITSVLDSYDEFVRISGKSLVNTAIAIAFDSTFISLVMSIIAMLWQQTAASHEEEVIQSQSDECISAITSAASAKAPTRPLSSPTPHAAIDLERFLEALRGIVPRPIGDPGNAKPVIELSDKNEPTAARYFAVTFTVTLGVLVVVALLYVILWKHLLIW